MNGGLLVEGDMIWREVATAAQRFEANPSIGLYSDSRYAPVCQGHPQPCLGWEL